MHTFFALLVSAMAGKKEMGKEYCTYASTTITTRKEYYSPHATPIGSEAAWRNWKTKTWKSVTVLRKL